MKCNSTASILIGGLIEGAALAFMLWCFGLLK